MAIIHSSVVKMWWSQ